jgi:hypothetical protein
MLDSLISRWRLKPNGINDMFFIAASGSEATKISTQLQMFPPYSLSAEAEFSSYRRAASAGA